MDVSTVIISIGPEPTTLVSHQFHAVVRIFKGSHSSFDIFSFSFILPFNKMRIFVNILVIVGEVVRVDHFIILKKLYLNAARLDVELEIVLISSVVE